MPTSRKSQLPGTLQRSPAKAQRTYSETLQHAEQEYGRGRRASQTAYAELEERANSLGIKGRSSTTKEELGRAIGRKQD